MTGVTVVVVAAFFVVSLAVSVGCVGGGTRGGTASCNLKYVDTHAHLSARSPGRTEQAAPSVLASMDELGVSQSLIPNADSIASAGRRTWS